MPLCFSLCCSTIYWTHIGCTFVTHFGANHTFIIHSIKKPTPAVDFVIADIPEDFPCLAFQYLLIQYLVKMQSLINLLFFVILFYMQYCYDRGALLIFHLKYPKWTKILSSYFFNYNFKVGHKPWTCINPLLWANPCTPNKTVSLTMFFITFFWVSWIMLFVYIIIWLLFFCFPFFPFCADRQLHIVFFCVHFK